MTFDVLNTWCVSTQFHPVLVISVPCWRALALKTTTRKKHPPHFLYNLFACRIGYWTCCFYCNLSQKNKCFFPLLCEVQTLFFHIFSTKIHPPPKKNTKKSTACFVDMTYLTPPQQHEKRTDEVLILRLAELADLEELEPGGWSWLIPPTFGDQVWSLFWITWE